MAAALTDQLESELPRPSRLVEQGRPPQPPSQRRSVTIRPSARQLARSYHAAALGSAAGGGWMLSALLRIAGHPGHAEVDLFSIGFTATVLCGPLAAMLLRGRLRISDGLVSQRGTVRTRSWPIAAVDRIARGWSEDKLRFVYLRDADGRCLTHLETTWWWPESTGEQLSAALNLPIYAGTCDMRDGATPWWIRHRCVAGIAVSAVVVAVVCIGIALGEYLAS